MKKFVLFSSRCLSAFACLAFLILAGNNPVSGQTFKLGGVSEFDRIFEDGYNLPVLHDTLEISGIRGEVISGQCAIQTKSSLNDITVSLSELKHHTKGTIIPANNVEWDFVGSIPLTENTPNQPKRVLTRLAPARFPDYLMAEKQISLKEKSCQGIWLSVNIPANLEAGEYSGKLTVKSSQGEKSIPLKLNIYPLILPETRHLIVTEWYNTEGFDHFHGIREEYSPAWFAMLGKYAANMAAHRQNMFQVPMEAIEIQQANNGQLIFDFSRFDQIAQVFWDTKKMDYLETGEITKFGEGAWNSSEILLKNFKVKNQATGKEVSIEGKDVIPLLLPALESHLRQKSWLTKSMFHIKDEPSMHNSMAYRDMSSYIHKYSPDLKRFDAIENSNMLDYVEVAVPKLDAFGTWYDSYRNAQQKGTEIWFYTVGIYQGSLFPNKTIDVPVMNSRIMHWLNYRYDATGYLHWGWNQWEENPYKAVGMHIGDGWHVYPVKDGVLNSLRWEEMRNGIQDYECFRMLEDKVCALKDSLGERASWIDPKQRGKEIAGEVVMTIADHTDDALVFNRAKKQLIGEIIDFNSSPRVFIQTIPMENSVITFHSSVEVFGWTEPGTKIVVNGKELPVNAEGYFLDQFQIEPADPIKAPLSHAVIKVLATNAKGTKEVTRNYGIRF